MRNKWMIGLVLALSAGLAVAAAPKKVVLDVQNVTCAACSITIGKALDKVPGVQSKQVDAQAATVTVVFDPERTSVSALSRAITDAGFPAKVRADGG
jgi:mercuric ion binding protein